MDLWANLVEAFSQLRFPLLKRLYLVPSWHKASQHSWLPEHEWGFICRCMGRSLFTGPFAPNFCFWRRGVSKRLIDLVKCLIDIRTEGCNEGKASTHSEKEKLLLLGPLCKSREQKAIMSPKMGQRWANLIQWDLDVFYFLVFLDEAGIQKDPRILLDKGNV